MNETHDYYRYRQLFGDPPIVTPSPIMAFTAVEGDPAWTPVADYSVDETIRAGWTAPLNIIIDYDDTTTDGDSDTERISSAEFLDPITAESYTASRRRVSTYSAVSDGGAPAIITYTKAEEIDAPIYTGTPPTRISEITCTDGTSISGYLDWRRKVILACEEVVV